jgi:hypothetical protein
MRMLLWWSLGSVLGGCVLGGCATATRRSDAQVLASWSGPPPHVKLQLVGPAASDDNQRSCDQQVARAGAIVDGNAQVQAILLLQDGHNRMQVVSRNLGTVRDEEVAGSADDLCGVALRAVVATIHDESKSRASVMPQPGSTPPGFSTRTPDMLPGNEGPTRSGPAPGPPQLDLSQ